MDLTLHVQMQVFEVERRGGWLDLWFNPIGSHHLASRFFLVNTLLLPGLGLRFLELLLEFL